MNVVDISGLPCISEEERDKVAGELVRIWSMALPGSGWMPPVDLSIADLYAAAERSGYFLRVDLVRKEEGSK